MSTRKHIHLEEFQASPERLFSLLVTPSSIREWWSAARAIVIPETAGIWAAAWGDDEDAPEYIAVATIRCLNRQVGLNWGITNTMRSRGRSRLMRILRRSLRSRRLQAEHRSK